jgi:RNA polymerase sigma factor (TIGR02999 family)
MSDVTRLLSQIESGDPFAAERLLPLVYDELRQLAAAKLAGERSDHTLQPTALVHEVYLRLVGSSQPWHSRAQFFAAAANSMRQILVNWALARQTQKRGGGAKRVSIEELAVDGCIQADMILDLNDSLAELAKDDPDAAELVQLRLFAGLSVTEAGEFLGLSRTSAYQTWQFARAWFATHRVDLREE